MLMNLVAKIEQFLRSENGVFLFFLLLAISLFYVVKRLVMGLPQYGSSEILIWGGAILPSGDNRQCADAGASASDARGVHCAVYAICLLSCIPQDTA